MVEIVGWVASLERRQALWRAIDIVSISNGDLLEKVRAREVYHYTDLGAAPPLLSTRNFWLTDAMYCNDSKEIIEAAGIIEEAWDEINKTGMLTLAPGSIIGFATAEVANFNLAYAGYSATRTGFSALVCCFCEGDHTLTGLSPSRKPQDILSQWRAYGANGRGICVSVPAIDLLTAASGVAGLSFQPVLYYKAAQRQLLADLIKGTTSAGNLRDALFMITPLFKHPGFAEEREWRLVFLPQFAAASLALRFRARSDLLIPYLDVDSIIGGTNSLSITEVMCGPSNLPDLNEAAIGRIPGVTASILRSAIPYRV